MGMVIRFIFAVLFCSLPLKYGFCEMHSCKDKNGNMYFADEAWKLPSNCVDKSSIQTESPSGTGRQGKSPSSGESGQGARPGVSQQSAGSAGEETYSSQGLLRLLAEKKYITLNDKIAEAQRAYERDFRKEKKMTGSLEEFEVPDPKLEALLNEWAAHDANDFQPYLCRAAYLYTRAVYARGFAYASETSQERFQDTDRFLQKTSADLRKALQLKPGLVHAYAYLINVTTLVSAGDGVDPKHFLDEALKINPYTLVAREKYLGNLQPRWGGSLEEMRAFVEESRRYFNAYPALKILEGQVYTAEGLEEDSADNYKQAIELYTKALTFGKSAYIYWRRGNAYRHMPLYTKAIADYSEAIALDPNFILAYYSRIEARGKVGDQYGARVDLCQLRQLGQSVQDMARELRGFESNIKAVLAAGCPK